MVDRILLPVLPSRQLVLQHSMKYTKLTITGTDQYGKTVIEEVIVPVIPWYQRLWRRVLWVLHIGRWPVVTSIVVKK